MTACILEIAALLIMFLGTLLAKRVDRLAQDPRRIAKFIIISYWSTIVGSLIVGAVVILVKRQSEQAHEARLDAATLAAEGRQYFHLGLDKSSPMTMELSFPRLEAAIRTFSRSEPDQRHQLAATYDLALARERVAYAGAETGSLLWLDDRGEGICRLSVNEGSDIQTAPVPRFRGKIRCTDVSQERMWTSARKAYRSLDSLLASLARGDALSPDLLYLISDEFVPASRSLAYFLICDALRTSDVGSRTDVLRRADVALERLLRTLSVDQMPLRFRDAEMMREFVRALTAGKLVRPCS